MQVRVEEAQTVGKKKCFWILMGEEGEARVRSQVEVVVAQQLAKFVVPLQKHSAPPSPQDSVLYDHSSEAGEVVEVRAVHLSRSCMDRIRCHHLVRWLFVIQELEVAEVRVECLVVKGSVSILEQAEVWEHFLVVAEGPRKAPDSMKAWEDPVRVGSRMKMKQPPDQMASVQWEEEAAVSCL